MECSPIFAVLGTGVAALNSSLGINKHGFSVGNYSVPRCNLLRSSIPYCFKALPDGRFILLNRDYKPLGIAGGTCDPFVDYEAFGAHIVKDDSSIIAAAMTMKCCPHDSIYFFRDSCPPWAGKRHAVALLDKMNRLLSIAKGGM